MAPELLVNDPIYPPKDAAIYLGFRGKDPTRSLRRLKLKRSRLPSSGKQERWGYRLSELNRYLASIDDLKSRAPMARAS